MPNWTRFDPGAGDLTACDRAKQWTDSQASGLADARSAVSAILRDLDDIWAGESADAFRARILEFHDRLEASEEAMRIAGKGILAYADTVAEIARRAAPLKHRLEAAELILNGVHSETLFGTDPEGLARRFDAEQQATIDAQDAADELARLADAREKADQVLAALLARTASEAWGALDCTASPSGKSPRELANGRVGDLLSDFLSGRDGASGVVLGPDDPFVATLMHSDHINGARTEVVDALRSGRLGPKRCTHDFHPPRPLSNRGGCSSPSHDTHPRQLCPRPRRHLSHRRLGSGRRRQRHPHNQPRRHIHDDRCLL